MAKTKIKKNIVLIAILIMCLFIFPINSKAASFTPSAKTTLTTGESTTLTLKIVDCVGKFEVTSSDSSIVSVNNSVISADDSNNVTFTR